MYFVPAFSGLFAPYWRGDARGVAVGLTQYVTKGPLLKKVGIFVLIQIFSSFLTSDCGGVRFSDLRYDSSTYQSQLLFILVWVNIFANIFALNFA